MIISACFEFDWVIYFSPFGRPNQKDFLENFIQYIFLEAWV